MIKPADFGKLSSFNARPATATLNDFCFYTTPNTRPTPGIFIYESTLSTVLRLIPVANEHLDIVEERADSGHRTFPFLRGGEEQFDQAAHVVRVVHWDDSHCDAPYSSGTLGHVISHPGGVITFKL